MSFIDVRDLAALHVAALENEGAKGRFFGVCENSTHFEDVAKMLKEYYPSIEIPPPLEDERVRGTQNNIIQYNIIQYNINHPIQQNHT